MYEKCARLKIDIDQKTKTDFFGRYAQCPSKFTFNDEERSLIHYLSRQSTEACSFSFSEQEKHEIANKVEAKLNWFQNSTTENVKIDAPKEAQNFSPRFLQRQKIMRYGQNTNIVILNV